MIMMCHCRFMLMMGEAKHLWNQGIWEISVPFIQFCSDAKTTLKNKIFFLKNAVHRQRSESILLTGPFQTDWSISLSELCIGPRQWMGVQIRSFPRILKTSRSIIYSQNNLSQNTTNKTKWRKTLKAKKNFELGNLTAGLASKVILTIFAKTVF